MTMQERRELCRHCRVGSTPTHWDQASKSLDRNQNYRFKCGIHSSAVQSVKISSILMSDRRTPFSLRGERQTLIEFLNCVRESVIAKTEGLGEESVRR
jgi:hypothetical protein